MGFLDKIIGKADELVTKAAASSAVDAISSTIGKAADGLSSAINNPAPTQPAAAQPAAAPAAPVAAQDTEVRSASGQRIPQLKVKRNKPFSLAPGVTPSEIKDTGSTEYIADVIRKNMPEVTVQTNVDLRTLSASIPYTYVDVPVLVSFGSRRAAILITPKNHYKNACYVYTMNTLEDAGIMAIRVFPEFPNKPEYIVGRVRSLFY